jgi:hypothetical protein
LRRPGRLLALLGAAGLGLAWATAADAVRRDPFTRLKVSTDGKLYLNRKEVDPTELATQLLALKAENKPVVYYREAMESSPPPEKIKALLEIINATKAALLRPQEAPSEYGKLTMVEVEIAPHRFRIALARREPYFIGFTPKGGNKPIMSFGPALPKKEERLEQVDMLISADRVMETWVYDEGAFEPDTLERPSVHVRVLYDERTGWQSWYPMDQVPPNIRSFVEDSRAVAAQIMPEADAKLLRALKLWEKFR